MMKKSLFTLMLSLLLGSVACKSQTNENLESMKNEIKDVVYAFAKAGEERNIQAYDDILHSDFRVIANRYPTPDKTSIIAAENYIGLLAKEVIGGTKFNVEFKHVEVMDHSAVVVAHFKAEKGSQLVTILLIKNTEDKWQMVTDMAVQK